MVHGEKPTLEVPAPRSGEVLGAQQLELEDLKWHTELGWNSQL
jgi:hypothetical protein